MNQAEFIQDALARPRDERRILIAGHFTEQCRRPGSTHPDWPLEKAYLYDTWFLLLPQNVKDDLNEDIGGPGSQPDPPDALSASLRAEFIRKQ